jgi:hypothetical protein
MGHFCQIFCCIATKLLQMAPTAPGSRAPQGTRCEVYGILRRHLYCLGVILRPLVRILLRKRYPFLLIVMSKIITTITTGNKW